MDVKEARDIVNKKFVYEGDGRLDVWEVLDVDKDKIHGDCEDYSLTLIWVAENRNILKFIFALLTMKYIIWFVKTPRGVGHAITYVRKEGKYIDNIMKDFKTKDEYKKAGFKFLFPFASVLVAPKLFFSYTVGLLFR